MHLKYLRKAKIKFNEPLLDQDEMLGTINKDLKEDNAKK
jgi:hypothetical protein